MGQFHLVELQGAAESLYCFGRRRNGAALLQLGIPFGADAGALRHFFAFEARCAAPLPGPIAGAIRRQSCTPRP